MSQFLRHETAMALTVRLLDLVTPCLTTEAERTEAFGLFYDAVLATLREHDEKLGRELRRLCRPSAN